MLNHSLTLNCCPIRSRPLITAADGLHITKWNNFTPLACAVKGINRPLGTSRSRANLVEKPTNALLRAAEQAAGNAAGCSCARCEFLTPSLDIISREIMTSAVRELQQYPAIHPSEIVLSTTRRINPLWYLKICLKNIFFGFL